ncbi:zinc finger protein 229-like [Oncorhynchus masou masou]|uniref:zinc finger protein 229-like n=1 Tax=Oncorhynchus masou masou TaxID=90313 RepID=UPI0031833827
MMSEAIVTFQSQLSGVMETVFKAAMYEITRLVEDSFLKEMSRSREQVESLKKRLQWSENRRRDREGDQRGKCADCGRADGSQGEALEPHRQRVNGCGEGAWPEAGEGADGSDVSGPSKSFIQQDLQRCQDDWASGLEQHPEPPGPEGDPSQPLYRPRYSMEELGVGFEKSGYGSSGSGDHLLDMEGLDRLPGSPSRLGGLSYRAASHYQVDLGEGYLQDSASCTQNMVSQSQGNRAGHRGLTSIHSGSSAHNNTESLYGAADDLDSLNLRDRSQSRVWASYSCTQCGKTFTQACNLKVHQRVHQAKGLHLCSHCGKGFTSFSDLKRHKCSQTTDKPYCCSICGNKFSRLWNLKVHQRIHTQEKPHCCNMCDKSFTRADILKVHCAPTLGRDRAAVLCVDSASNDWHI